MADGSRTSTAAPVWARVLMPSMADLIFVALFAALVFTPLAMRLLGDAGIGWHIRAGQQILATHSIPRVDSFSSTMGGQPWYAWEWLYDLVVGRLEAVLGLNGVVWFTALVIAAVFAWLFRLLIVRGSNVLVALALVLLAFAASMIHMLARPHVVSWLFTLAWFWILQSSERESIHGQTRRLWVLPLLMLVWVNVHGGFVLGFVLLAIFLLGAIWDWWRTHENRIEDVLARIAARKRSRALAGAGLLSLAASLVNPYGLKLHLHVYSYLSDPFLMNHIEEFRSPDFHSVAQKCFLLLLLVTVATLAVRGRQLRMSEALTVLFAMYAGVYASRGIPVSSLLLVMVVGPLLSLPGVGQRFSARMTSVEQGLRGHVWPVAVGVLTLLIAANGGRIGSSQLMDAHYDSRRMPVRAVEFLNRRLNRDPRLSPPAKLEAFETVTVHGPVLSPDYWGGYLIYRLYPKAQVVADDRHDLYGEEFFKSYLKMWRVEPGWDEFLSEHDIGCALLPRQSALASILLETGRWKTAYEDETAILFVPAGSKTIR